MTKRTTEEMESAKNKIRKYSGRITSKQELAKLLHLTEQQLNDTLELMEEEAKEHLSKIADIAKVSRNWVKLCFAKTEQLGTSTRGKKKVGKFIDPLSLSYVKTEGMMRPQKYDFLYIITEVAETWTLKKYLVDSVVTRGPRLYIDALLIKNVQIESWDSYIDDGVERYLISIM